MAGHIDHLPGAGPADPARCRHPAWAGTGSEELLGRRGRRPGRRWPRAARATPPDMVAVVVGHYNGLQLQSPGWRSAVKRRRGLAWDRRPARALSVVQQPDVVVGKSGDGQQVHEQQNYRDASLDAICPRPLPAGMEQQRCDEAVADIFGYHSLQLGMPMLQGLRANRMPHRWLALDSMQDAVPAEAVPPLEVPVALLADPAALPFSEASLDLVVMPHTLETSPDPHAVLREAARVLMPEGRIVVCGLNPASLLGVQRRAERGVYLPDVGWGVGLLAAARLAAIAGLRDRGRAVRLLSSCRADGSLAAPLAVHGPRGAAGLAHAGRRVLRGGRQARAGRAHAGACLAWPRSRVGSLRACGPPHAGAGGAGQRSAFQPA